MITRKTIKIWLENYVSLAVGERLPDVIQNSGPKNYDGISGGYLNKVMLDDVINKLPPLTKACVQIRWIRCLPVAKSLKTIGITRDQYNRLCDEAVDTIYRNINGGLLGAKKLAEAILGEN